MSNHGHQPLIETRSPTIQIQPIKIISRPRVNLLNTLCFIESSMTMLISKPTAIYQHGKKWIRKQKKEHQIPELEKYLLQGIYSLPEFDETKIVSEYLIFFEQFPGIFQSIEKYKCIVRQCERHYIKKTATTPILVPHDLFLKVNDIFARYTSLQFLHQKLRERWLTMEHFDDFTNFLEKTDLLWEAETLNPESFDKIKFELGDTGKNFLDKLIFRILEQGSTKTEETCKANSL